MDVTKSKMAIKKKYVKTKYNLACGKDYKKGYLNIDNQSMFPDCKVDINSDIFKLQIDRNSADEIYVSHFLMYVRPEELMTLLSSWFNSLKSNGRLIIVNTDIRKIAQIVANESDPIKIDNWGLTNLFGNKVTAPHKWGWYPESLAIALYKIGFAELKYGVGDKKPNRDFKITAIKL